MPHAFSPRSISSAPLEKTLAGAAIGADALHDSAGADQQELVEVLAQFAGLGMTEQQRIADAQINRIRMAHRRLYLARAFVRHQAAALRQPRSRQSIGTRGTRGRIAAA